MRNRHRNRYKVTPLDNGYLVERTEFFGPPIPRMELTDTVYCETVDDALEILKALMVKDVDAQKIPLEE